jgi:hypothetical protein
MAEQLPVFVQVKRPDGSMEKVRVGTATRDGGEFVLSLGELTIGATPDPVRRAAPAASAPAAGGGGGGSGEVFPPYGRSKGMPIAGASMGDLEFYANGSKRSLADPSKSRWHDKERQLLAAIEAEIVRQGGVPSADVPAPRPSGGGRSGGGRQSAPPSFGEEPPPPGDDDIPF